MLKSSVILKSQVMTSFIHCYHVKTKVACHLLKENAKYNDIASAHRKKSLGTANAKILLNLILIKDFLTWPT